MKPFTSLLLFLPLAVSSQDYLLLQMGSNSNIIFMSANNVIEINKIKSYDYPPFKISKDTILVRYKTASSDSEPQDTCFSIKYLFTSTHDLVGFNCTDTKVDFYTSENGYISTKSFPLSIFNSIPINLLCHKSTQSSTSKMIGDKNNIYNFDSSYLIKTDIWGLQLFNIKDSLLIYEKSNKVRSWMGITDLRYCYYNSQFSKIPNIIITERMYFYKNSNFIIEIDCLSGKSKVICKNCYDPIFSESHNFILYKSINFSKNISHVPLFYIYDINRGLSTPIKDVKNAFWLY